MDPLFPTQPLVSVVMPKAVFGEILSNFEFKELIPIRRVCKSWRNLLNSSEVWKQIISRITASDCQWLSEKRSMYPMSLQKTFACPEARVTFFLTDTVSKGIFYPPLQDFESQLIDYLCSVTFKHQMLNAYNNPAAVHALDIFLAKACDRLTKVNIYTEEGNWNLLQMTIKNGLECCFLRLLVKICGNEFNNNRDPLGHDLLYWSITKCCRNATVALLERGAIIEPSHVLAAVGSGEISELQFVLNLGKKTLTLTQIYDLCQEMIEKHPGERFPFFIHLLGHGVDLGLTAIHINNLAEAAYKAKAVQFLETLIRHYRANVNFMDMILALHSQIYSSEDQDKLDNLFYDMIRMSKEHLPIYLRLNLVYYLASLGSIKTFALIFPSVELDNHFFENHTTPLHAACAHWQTDFARILINQRGRCDDRDHNQNTPFHAAFLEKRAYDPIVRAFIQMMLEAGADPYALNNNGESPLDLAQEGLGNEILDEFPPLLIYEYTITPETDRSKPFWFALPRLNRLKAFTAERMSWYQNAKTVTSDVVQLQDMSPNSMGRHWSLPTVERVNVSEGEFFAYSWVHLFKSFPKAHYFDFSQCKLQTLDPFQDQLKFLELFFKELERERCTVNLRFAKFQTHPIVFTPKQIQLFKELYPWLTIEAQVEGYNYRSTIDRKQAHEILSSNGCKRGTYILHASPIEGDGQCFEISQKISEGNIANYFVRIHPMLDSLFYYRLVRGSYHMVNTYANVYVFLADMRANILQVT